MHGQESNPTHMFYIELGIDVNSHYTCYAYEYASYGISMYIIPGTTKMQYQR